MFDLFHHICAAIAALCLLFVLTSHARAEKRVEVRPYLELDQVVVADLKGGSNDVLTYSSAAAAVDGSIRTRNAEAQVNVRCEHQFSCNDALADQAVISGLAKGRVSLARDALSLEGGAMATRTRSDGLGGAKGRKSPRLNSSHHSA